ncbi:MAG: glycosyltransferase family 9 protein [Gemmatimonadaceae bacterium]
MNADIWSPRPARVAVFRALQLGDMLCAVPALRALRAFLPQADITLVGLPWAADFVARYRHLVDDFIALPGYPGNPEQEGPVEGLLDCLNAARERRFDVALQMHGDGAITNRIVALMGAGRMAGFRARGSQPRPGFIPWPDSQREPHRYLSLMAFLGVPLQGDHLEMPLEDADHAGWRALATEHGLVAGGFVCIHPGARMRSRRWPVERFVAVGRALAANGWRVVVTGSPGEAGLTAAVASGLPGTVDLTGRTTLGSLAAMLRESALLVCNDTGISHVAAAVGAKSVVVASGSDVNRWAPLDPTRHAVVWRDMPCRPCAHETCPVGHGCALGVGVPEVLVRARAFLAERLPDAA